MPYGSLLGCQINNVATRFLCLASPSSLTGLSPPFWLGCLSVDRMLRPSPRPEHKRIWREYASHVLRPDEMPHPSCEHPLSLMKRTMPVCRGQKGPGGQL